MNTNELHSHYCPECKFCGKPDWTHDRTNGCKIEDGQRYPCPRHILFHGVRVSTTKEGAKQIYEEELRMKQELENDAYEYYMFLRGEKPKGVRNEGLPNKPS